MKPGKPRGGGRRFRAASWVWVALPFLYSGGEQAHFADDFGEKVEIREEGWPVPNPEEARIQGRRWLDRTPQIKDKETKAVGFVGKKYPLFVVWSIDGERFAFIVDEDGRAPFEYGLWDMDGDGKFETKTGAYRDIPAPEWVVDKYFLRRGLVPPSRKKEAPEAGGSKVTGDAPSGPS